MCVYFVCSCLENKKKISNSMTEFISVSDTENMVTFCGTSFMKDMGVRCYVEFQ